MKRIEYEVVISRVETCRVRVKAASRQDAVKNAVSMEMRGEITNHVYSDERIEATIVGRTQKFQIG